MSKVTIVQRVLPHYRIPFFVKLRESLANNGIDLKLLYGQEYPGTVPRTVILEKLWAIRIQNKYLKTPVGELVWQPCLRHCKGSDLIIIEQANRLLVNYLLHSQLVRGRAKIAFWGHGRNFQAKSTNGGREKFKRLIINKPDWWFAYTNMSAQVVCDSGYPKDKITAVENSIDTGMLAEACAKVDENSIQEVRRTLGIDSENVCVFCGGLDANKKIEFLLEACTLVRVLLPDFHLIVIGDGPLQKLITRACENNTWIHYVGPRFHDERVPFLKAAKAMMMPGLLGLVILDSFVAGVPIFAINHDEHGPEIAYLVNGQNGVITKFNANTYAEAIVAYLTSPEKQMLLQAGCLASAERFTLENMVSNFATGVISCLNNRDS
ncbi:MAG: glycosyltransferase family 4 protein [Geobacteraceae bacterium]|nr:glycosyltransferase family 4 protein [Geobacteraceae bacterium]